MTIIPARAGIQIACGAIHRMLRQAEEANNEYLIPLINPCFQTISE